MVDVSAEVIALVIKEKFGTVSNFVVGKTSIITELIVDD